MEKKIAEKKRKFKWTKKKKIIVAVVVIIAVLIVGLWGLSIKSYLSVTDVINNQSKYMNQYIEVKGSVKIGSLTPNNKTFELTDGTHNLQINFTGVLPSNFEEGKEVVVKGTLRNKGILVIEAKEILVGCPSKY